MRSELTAVAVVLVLATAGCSTSPAPAPVAGRPATDAVSAPPAEAAPADTAPPAPSTPSTPTVPPGPGVMGPSVPVTLRIPAIGVDSRLIELGLLADGSMAVPPDGASAGWFDGAPTPGELGPAILAGHVDWATGPGVFYDLARLVAGDEVLVTRADGTIAVFAVTSVERYAKSQFPTDQVYGDIDHAGLRLITCGGTWNAATHHYESNTVVYADLIRSEQP